MKRKQAPPAAPLPDIVAIVAQYMENPTKIWPVLDRFEEDADAGLFGDEYDAVGRSTGRFELLTTVGNLRPESGFPIDLAVQLWFSYAGRFGHSWNGTEPKKGKHRHDVGRLGFSFGSFGGDSSWHSFHPDWNATSLANIGWTSKRWHFRSGYQRYASTTHAIAVRGHWQAAPVHFDATGIAWANYGAAGLLSCVVAAADYAHRIEAKNAAKGNA